MKPPHTIIAATSFCLLLLGCEASRVDQGTGSMGQAAITSSNISRIAGTQWVLKKMVVGGNEYELADKVPFLSVEESGRVGGNASVNRFFGEMRLDEEGAIEWTFPFGTTRMAGPELLMKQEDIFLKALGETDRISTEGDLLHIHSEDGLTKLAFYATEK